MKRWIVTALALLLCVGCTSLKQQVPASSSAEQEGSRLEEEACSIDSYQGQSLLEQQEASVVLSEPILVTSLGQSTDGMLAREMLTDLNVSFTYESVADPQQLKNYRTVLLAVGASSKALGASGMTAEQEYRRSEQLLEALTPESTVVMIRMGDSSKQDQLTTDLIKVTVPYAQMIIVTEHSDRDGTIERYAERYQIPYRSCGNVREMGALLGELILQEPS